MRQILLRGAKIGLTDENYSFMTIRGAIKHLEHLVEKKNDVYHLKVSTKEDSKNILMLRIYRNGLGHVFWNEAIVACALTSFGQEIAWNEGVTIPRLWQEVSFLHSLIAREFQLREKITENNFPSLVALMAERGILKLEEIDNTLHVKVIECGFLCLKL